VGRGEAPDATGAFTGEPLACSASAETAAIAPTVSPLTTAHEGMPTALPFSLSGVDGQSRWATSVAQ